MPMTGGETGAGGVGVSGGATAAGFSRRRVGEDFFFMRSCSACVSGVCFQRSQKLVRSLRSDVPDIEANAPMAQSNWIVVPQAQTGIVIDWNGCLKPKTAKNSRSIGGIGAVGALCVAGPSFHR